MVGVLVSGADIILVTTQILWSLGKSGSLFFFALFLTILGMLALILPTTELFVLNAHKPHIR